MGLIGPNGAGKSTLLRLASGLGRPNRGGSRSRRGGLGAHLGDTFDSSSDGATDALTAAIVAGVPAPARAPSARDARLRRARGLRRRRGAHVLRGHEAAAGLLGDRPARAGGARARRGHRRGRPGFQAKCAERSRSCASAAPPCCSPRIPSTRSRRSASRRLAPGRRRARGGEAARWWRPPLGDALGHDGQHPAPSANGGGGLEACAATASAPGGHDRARGVHGGGGEPVRELRVGERSPGLRHRECTRVRSDGHPGVTFDRVGDGLVCDDASTEADGVDVGGDGPTSVALAFDRLDLLPATMRWTSACTPPVGAGQRLPLAGL